MKNKIVLFSVLAVFVLFAVIAVSSALADRPQKQIDHHQRVIGDSSVWFDPQDSSAEYCETVDVDVWIQTVVPSAGFSGEFDYTFCCANVTDFVGNYTNWDLWCEANLIPPGHVKIVASTLESNPANQSVHIGTLTIHCCDETGSCLTDLVWDTSESYIEDPDDIEIMPVDWLPGTFSCESQEKPDLVVEKSVEFDDGKFIVSYTVRNIGDGPAGESKTCKYVDGVEMEREPCPALGPGASHSSAFNPEDCPCGETLNVTVCADNDNVVAESDETNNCEVNFIDCPPCKPDLIVEKSVEFDDGKFIVSYTVRNIGDGPAGESKTCKYVDGVEMEREPCPALGAGASHSSAFNPEDCPCGETLNVTVCADNDNVVAESDETNNCEVNFIDCPPCKPDLIVEKSVEFDDGKFIVSYTVRNIGGGDAGESKTCKYVDSVLQETQDCPALAPEESYSDAFAPEECPCGETLNVTVCADNADVVDESNETNNCEVNIIECPYIEVDIRADGIASNIFDITGYMICPGTVTEDGVTIDNETAMGALVIYCQNNGINIQITIGTLGEYVVQIGNDPADNNSWSYAVNEVRPPVGGAQKVIVDGDRVHWYNYNLHYYEVLTALDKTEIVVGETLTATVTWKNIAGIHLLNGASVYVGAMGDWGPEEGTLVGTTGVDGTCTFSWPTVGTWGVYAVDPVHGSGQYNYPYVTFTCSAEEKPDLEVNKAVSLSDSTFTVNYTVTNIGAALANESTTCKYVDSKLMEHQACPTLNPGESYNGSFNPEPCPCGSILNVTVCADNDDVVNESDETNNCEVNFVDCPPCKPDLNVSKITVNYDASSLGGRAIGPIHGDDVYTECNNLSAVIEEENVVDVLASFDVSFTIDGTTLCTVRVPGLTGGANKTVYCNCSWYPYAGDVFAIDVTVDSNNEIPETNETNNTKWNNGTAVSNGYKGDGWQGPDRNLINEQCHDQDTINLIYSVGDSEYVSGSTHWTEYTSSWTTTDLSVPAGAEIEKAMLYVYYTWDKNNVMPDNVAMAFNGNNIALARDYSDRKGFGSSNYPSGMLIYDVLNNFAATGPNNAILTKAVAPDVTKAAAADVVSMRGMLLMVVYKHPDEPERMICIDEGYDMLYAKDSYAVTSEEATTYAPFTCCEQIPVDELGKATLIAVAPSASDGDDMNRLSFNDGLWNGIWDHYEAATQLGIAEANVLAYLKPTENRANFQSHIPAGGDKGDFMDASNAFLILEKRPKPDLTVTEITVNYDASSLGGRAIGPVPGDDVYTECNNLSAVIGECNGVDVGSPFDVSFEVDGTTLCTVRVPGLTGGANKTVYCNCSWYPYAGDVFAIDVTVDSNNEIPETNETNNTKWNNGTAVSNGYKGDGWQGPDKNLINEQCHDQDTINLTYSVGDSEYVSGSTHWTEYTSSWTTTDLPVPDGAEIEKAMLYVYYTWDKNNVMPDNVAMEFNGNNIALARDYSDRKGFGDYDFPSGMLIYDVLNNFAATGTNNAILTKAVAPDVTKAVAADEVSMRGMLLMVIYNHPGEPERIICIDEGYDMLYAKDSYAITSEEATTYAPFTCCEPVAVEGIGKATLIAVAPSASDGDDMNRLSFNDGLWNGIWDHYEAATQLGIAEANVLAYLKPAENRANFQSHIPAGGDKGDFMDASNAFLILEKKGEIPCPAKYAVYQAKVRDPEGRLNDLRALRDNKLEDGYVTRYYEYSPALTMVLSRADSDLVKEGAQLVSKYSIPVGLHVQGMDVDERITRQDVEEALSFTDRLKSEVMKNRDAIGAKSTEAIIDFIDEFEGQVNASEGKTFSEALKSSIYYEDEQLRVDQAIVKE